MCGSLSSSTVTASETDNDKFFDADDSQTYFQTDHQFAYKS